MRRHGHGPGFCDYTEVAAQSNENNGADLRHAGAGSGVGYSSRAGYSNPFVSSSPSRFLEPLFETPPKATSEVKPSLATDRSTPFFETWDREYARRLGVWRGIREVERQHGVGDSCWSVSTTKLRATAAAPIGWSFSAVNRCGDYEHLHSRGQCCSSH